MRPYFFFYYRNQNQKITKSKKSQKWQNHKIKKSTKSQNQKISEKIITNHVALPIVWLLWELVRRIVPIRLRHAAYECQQWSQAWRSWTLEWEPEEKKINNWISILKWCKIPLEITWSGNSSSATVLETDNDRSHYTVYPARKPRETFQSNSWPQSGSNSVVTPKSLPILSRAPMNVDSA